LQLQPDDRIGDFAKRPERQLVLHAVAHVRAAAAVIFERVRVHPTTIRAAELFILEQNRRLPARDASLPRKGHAEEVETILDQRSLSHPDRCRRHDLESEFSRRDQLQVFCSREEREHFAPRDGKMECIREQVHQIQRMVASRPVYLVNTVLTHRLARLADLQALETLMEAAIRELQKPFLTDDQIASSRLIMGLDTQLIEDRTYYVVEERGTIIGCGGWSRRATLYGGDQTPGRSAALLDPSKDAARVRAMYTHPAHARKGVGRLILSLCERDARANGFTRVELMSTMAGEPLYRACGYAPIERVTDTRGGVPVPLVRMEKSLAVELPFGDG
jgi:GNAT superfamily N-acetyltransferase